MAEAGKEVMGRKILIVSVEVAPQAKVGGLADVAASLPKALIELGHDARIIMPGYALMIHDRAVGAKETSTPYDVRVNRNWSVKTQALSANFDGVPGWLVKDGAMFETIHRSEDVYTPGRDAYIYFAKAILEICEREKWIPDVVHCNDWHTGLLPVILRELGGPEWAHVATVFTIHNLAYQGEFGPDTIDVAELPHSLYNMHQLETFGGVNFLAAGAKFADAVNTVSPTYAKEIQTEEYGVRLWGLMRDLAGLGRLRGILNGIDQGFFNPETDPDLPVHYSAADRAGKKECKRLLQAELGLPEVADAPLLSMVSRLSDQKGFPLVLESAYGLLEKGAQLVILATGDRWLGSQFHRLSQDWPDRVRFVEKYDGPLGQRIYAGSDIFLMPSMFEPCGLGQMIAFRYGTIPVVRKTGGLADTVFEGQNGFVFEEKSTRDFYRAVTRAIDVYRDQAAWDDLVARTMQIDCSWSRSAQEYLDMYEDAIGSRLGVAVLNH